MKIFIVRHGETDYNRKKLLMGQLDVPLNEIGLKQAKKVAKSLKDKDITSIFSSSLIRAFKTAEIVGEELGLDVTDVPEFIEHTLGKMDGAKWTDEFDTMTGEELEKLLIENEAEDLNIFYKRVWRKFKEIVENNKGDGNLLIVTHGGCTRVIIMNILKTSGDIFGSLKQDNGCINVVSYRKNRVRNKFVIENINECCHLEELQTQI